MTLVNITDDLNYMLGLTTREADIEITPAMMADAFRLREEMEIRNFIESLDSDEDEDDK